MLEFGLIFITPALLPQGAYGLIQVLFLAAVYGYILFSASNLISNGSELLLLVPSIAGLVGSVILPILGAVPDGMIVLFSGMGPNAQEQVAVGVGALAGSTIMLLTIPWFMAIVGGRVNIDHSGKAVYRRPRTAPETWKKLDPPGHMSLTRTGIAVYDTIAKNGRIMLVTAMAYLVIQLPAFFVMRDPPRDQHYIERTAALIGAA
eukprot:Platyproteum_vivax@DN6918_c0_g1_i5.p1